MKTQQPLALDVRLMNLGALALFMLALAYGLAAVVWWGVQRPWFALNGITVTGDVLHNNALTLRANVAPQLRGNFFTIDLDKTRSSFESLPWVRRAVVRRMFPNRLQVHLQEHVPVAFWGDENEPRLLNSHGEIFEANVDDVESDDLPQLDGPPDRAAEVWSMYQSLNPLFKRLALNLDRLSLNGRGSWQARLDTGAWLELGRGTPAELLARTQDFVQTLTQVSSRYGRRVQSVEQADLRYTDGYALRLRGVTTVTTDVTRTTR
jgi:cell division protein FtsQ